MTLATGQPRVIEVGFNPTKPGEKHDMIEVFTSASGGPLVAELIGRGKPPDPNKPHNPNREDDGD
ncbi:MAG TPA: hypothetical protein VEF03_02650 [Candidatus Binataceae bacterium]|nr:hypothetical protein [Candidatus Binataceae bacterium]